ncbi:hypothetical protein [Acidithiobacillus thiooxidans]
MEVNLAGQDLFIIPAHYMHSVGNFQVADFGPIPLPRTYRA